MYLKISSWSLLRHSATPLFKKCHKTVSLPRLLCWGQCLMNTLMKFLQIRIKYSQALKSKVIKFGGQTCDLASAPVSDCSIVVEPCTSVNTDFNQILSFFLTFIFLTFLFAWMLFTWPSTLRSTHCSHDMNLLTSIALT